METKYLIALAVVGLLLLVGVVIAVLLFVATMVLGIGF